MTLVSRKFFLRRSKMLEFLSALEKTDDTTAHSIYLSSGLSAPEIERLLGKATVIPFPMKELTQVVAQSRTGAVIFWGDLRKCLVLPPFPIKEKAVHNGYVVKPLRLLLQSNFRIGLILIHLGAYAIGLCEGEKLVTTKVGTGLVHARHKKGGSSQQRFQRRREKQIQEFLDRVCVHVQEQLGAQTQFLDYVIYSGPHHTVLSLQKRCPFLNLFENRTLTFFDVPSPRRKELETTVSRLWASGIMEWQES